MDPDIPLPSIEQVDQPAPSTTASTNNFTRFRDTIGTPLTSSSPSRTPYKTPLSHPATPAPISIPRSPSVNRYERHSSPNLVQKRSSSSLSVSRGQTPSRIQLRRVSSNLNPSSPNIAKAPDMVPPPPTPTASSVAAEFFQRELTTHTNARSRTVVFIHDSCYGHRFSRPRTSKAALATIVERPERILATVLGASTAYVRLGERHSEGAYGPHPARDVKTMPDPPFLLRKTTRSVALNHPAVTHVHGTKWMEELQIMCDSAESKLAMNGKELSRPIGYGKDESGNALPKLHEGDLYLCSESLAALQACLGGVCDAVDATFTTEAKRAFVCIRPPGHHCSSNFPSGFCWLNNVHVGISYAAIDYGLTHAAIIDFDLHHGDGSQTITWDHNRKAQSLPKNTAQYKKTPIGYYSLHDINSYPCEWGDEEKVRSASLCIENAHGQSIWNVHLEPWTSLDHFWQLYEAKYKILIDKTRVFLQYHSEQFRAAGIQPKAAIFISAGFDASQWEGHGMQRHNVNVPTEFYARFTSDIVRLSAEAGLGVDGRVISVLEGGYSDRALTSGVLSHICGLTEVAPGTTVNPGFGSLNGGLGIDSPKFQETSPHNHYEPAWWDTSNLEALEDRVAGNVAPLAKKKDKAPGNYASPTQAFTSKMTEVARERKSLSTQLENRLYLESLAPDPPPPVDWIVASYELSQILIPTDRQTLSCRHDELNAEATRVRRERQSLVGVAAPAEQRMQLRTRSKAHGADHEIGRAASRASNRRTTIAAVSELPDPSMPEQGLQRPRRRSSAASSILSGFQDMKLDDRSHATDIVPNVSRPSSAMADVNKDAAARKTRVPAATRRGAHKVSSPRKAKDIIQGSSNTTNLQSKAHAQATRGLAGSRLSSQSGRGGSENVVDRDHMDELSNGMKKVSIKLKMPTPEQHAENQKKAEEAKSKKPRVGRKPPVPKAPKLRVETIEASDSARQATPAGTIDPSGRDDTRTVTSGLSHPRDSSVLSEGTYPITSRDEHVAQRGARTVSSTDSSLQSTNGSITPSVTDSARSNTSNVTTQGSTNDAASARLASSGEQNSGQIIAGPPKAKSGLPVFTSNSRIAFASQETSAGGQQAQAKLEPSVWDTAEPPHGEMLTR